MDLASDLSFPWLSLKHPSNSYRILRYHPLVFLSLQSAQFKIWAKARGRILGVGSTHVPLKFSCSRCLDPFRLSLLVDLGNLGIILLFSQHWVPQNRLWFGSSSSSFQYGCRWKTGGGVWGSSCLYTLQEQGLTRHSTVLHGSCSNVIPASDALLGSSILASTYVG